MTTRTNRSREEHHLGDRGSVRRREMLEGLLLLAALVLLAIVARLPAG